MSYLSATWSQSTVDIYNAAYTMHNAVINASNPTWVLITVIPADVNTAESTITITVYVNGVKVNALGATRNKPAGETTAHYELGPYFVWSNTNLRVDVQSSHSSDTSVSLSGRIFDTLQNNVALWRESSPAVLADTDKVSASAQHMAANLLTSSVYDESTAYPLTASDGSGLTAIPWNAAWDEEVESEVADAFNVAIPGGPTANSINERLATLDDAYTAARAPYLDELAAANIPADLDALITTVGVAGAGLTGVTAVIGDGAITAAKFDQVTAFPVVFADTGATKIARVGDDGDTLETLSDEIGRISGTVNSGIDDDLWMCGTIGETYYVVIRDGTDAWDGDSFEDEVAGSRTDFDQTMTETPANSGRFLLTWPAAIDDGTYSVGLYRQIGAAAANTDTCVAGQVVYWDGTGLNLFSVSVIGAIGSGGTSTTIVCQVGGVPLDGVECWVSSDSAGTNVVAGVIVSDGDGEATFMLESGATRYIWRQKAGYNFDNPQTITVG